MNRRHHGDVHRRIKIENGIESAMDPHERRDLPDREQSPIRVGACAVSRVVANRQPLIRHAEDYLGTYDVTRQAEGMDLGARDGGAPCFPRTDRARQRNRGFGTAHLRQAERHSRAVPLGASTLSSCA